ncbi:unnamed protein product [Jaminaea pallidilutea]
MASSSASATNTARRQLLTLRSQIFSHAPPPPPHAPGGQRTGSKILSRRLVGPSMLSYYPMTLQMQSMRKFLPERPQHMLPRKHQINNKKKAQAALANSSKSEEVGEGQDAALADSNSATASVEGDASDFWDGTEKDLLMTLNERQRQVDVAYKKRLGKGPPKKGQGRRAALKGKKK